ncbi:hypothetical protein HAT86_07335 [Roseovarius gahaiensis]|uniref:DUF1127 domain-containing protein n=1 Tax=Roseovarius gahaiensis TaxID=2716691 RepID=A0A967BH93_9RHOB|nr:hypothetical protein [Roseovarius gahaiensis]NHQ74277.1 hypothetical protein [Roseovarius gahaiensis]
MVTLTTNITRAPTRFRVWLATLGAALLTKFEAHAYKASRRDQVDALETKSDAELARMGLRRDQIVHHVYRDLYYS